MLSEPRTISLLCDLIHLPAKHDLDALRAVYNRVASSSGYENFIRTPAGARLERHAPEGGGFSHLTFTGDRIQFAEDHMSLTVEEFALKVATVARLAMPILRIPVILVQQVTVRVIATPNTFKNAADFLAGSIFRIREGDLELLGRPANVFGFRLLFPATKENPASFNVRVESYLRDPQCVYVENVGTYKAPIQLASLESVEKNILATSSHMVDHLLPFLSRYDRRDPDT